MRKRNNRVQVRLDKDEYQYFIKRVKKSGVSQEVYLRHLINGLVPNDAPPPDYYSMMRELHKIGGNLNQIALKAHSLGVVDVARHDNACRELERAVRQITAAVVEPRPKI